MPRAIEPDLTHELRQSAWLAGFIDGEGHFAVHEDVRHGNSWPVLEITQRDDDLALMEDIGRALGGCLKRKVVPEAKLRAPYDHKPLARVCVISKVSLIAAVAYLDAHPLRTKKAREYEVWRVAVLAYVERGGKTPELNEAKADLQGLKNYRPPLMAVAA